jgi:hypothetical protein
MELHTLEAVILFLTTGLTGGVGMLRAEVVRLRKINEALIETNAELEHKAGQLELYKNCGGTGCPFKPKPAKP